MKHAVAIGVLLAGTVAGFSGSGGGDAAAQEAYRAGDVFRDCDVCPEMMVVPAGSFRMGSPLEEPGWEAAESPRHQVIISRPFAVAKYELTFTEFRACASDGGCNGYRADSRGGPGTMPVSLVNWRDAKLYTEWLSAKTGREYRLLTEAEWEYAARAGTEAEYVTGATTDPEHPNTFGLYGMHGNVIEWVEDLYHPTYEGAPADGRAWGSGEGERVTRGGSYASRTVIIRSALRGHANPGWRDFLVGFRVAMTLPAA